MNKTTPVTSNLITSTTVNNKAGYTLTLDTYYADNEEKDHLRELHLNLTLFTTDLPNTSDIHLGFFFKGDAAWEGSMTSDTPLEGYDGLDFKTNFTAANIATATFTGNDIYKATMPDVWTNGPTSSELPVDLDNAWMVNASKSTITCTIAATTDCTFKAHAMRTFKSNDEEHDYTFFDAEPRAFQVTGYYFAYDLNSSTPVTGDFKGQGTAVSIELGALSGLSFAAAALASTVFALTF